MNRVVVIPCTGAKLGHRAPAAELYTGATFWPAFAAATKLAGPTGRVLILSALHGLVAPTDELDPYNVKMGDAGSVTRATLVAQCLSRRLWSHHVVTMLPKAYRDALADALASMPHRFTDLYAGARGIGDHRSVMRRAAIGELEVAP